MAETKQKHDLDMLEEIIHGTNEMLSSAWLSITTQWSSVDLHGDRFTHPSGQIVADLMTSSAFSTIMSTNFPV